MNTNLNFAVFELSLSARKLLVRSQTIQQFNFKFFFSKILPFVILGEKCDIFETNKQQAYPRSIDLFVSLGVRAST